MHCVVICLLRRRFFACRYAIANALAHGLEGGAGRGGRLEAALALRSCFPILRSLVAVLLHVLLRERRPLALALLLLGRRAETGGRQLVPHAPCRRRRARAESLSIFDFLPRGRASCKLSYL